MTLTECGEYGHEYFLNDRELRLNISNRSEEELREIKRKRAAFAIEILKRKKRSEIIAKINAVFWAVAWSILSIQSILERTMGILLPIFIFGAVGFWALLIMSFGSVGRIKKEIRAAYEEYEKI